MWWVVDAFALLWSDGAVTLRAEEVCVCETRMWYNILLSADYFSSRTEIIVHIAWLKQVKNLKLMRRKLILALWLDYSMIVYYVWSNSCVCRDATYIVSQAIFECQKQLRLLLPRNIIQWCNHHLIAAIPRQMSPMSLFLRLRSFSWTTLAIRLSFRSLRAHFFMSLLGLNDTAAAAALAVVVVDDDDPNGRLTALRRIRRWHRFCLLLLLLKNLFVCFWWFEFRFDALGVLGWSWPWPWWLLWLLPFQQSGKSGKPGTPVPPLLPLLTVFSPALPSCIDSKWHISELAVATLAAAAFLLVVSGDAAVFMYRPRWSLWRGGNTNEMLSMFLTIEVPIDRLSFVALANSSSMEEEKDDESVTVLMGVDGGARSSIGEVSMLSVIPDNAPKQSINEFNRFVDDSWWNDHVCCRYCHISDLFT